jgi:hypothetical protein
MYAKGQKWTELIGCSSVDGNPNKNDNQNDRHPVLERHSLYGELSCQELQERIHSQHLYVLARLKISYLLPVEIAILYSQLMADFYSVALIFAIFQDRPVSGRVCEIGCG